METLSSDHVQRIKRKQEQKAQDLLDFGDGFPSIASFGEVPYTADPQWNTETLGTKIYNTYGNVPYTGYGADTITATTVEAPSKRTGMTVLLRPTENASAPSVPTPITTKKDLADVIAGVVMQHAQSNLSDEEILAMIEKETQVQAEKAREERMIREKVRMADRKKWRVEQAAIDAAQLYQQIVENRRAIVTSVVKTTVSVFLACGIFSALASTGLLAGAAAAAAGANGAAASVGAALFPAWFEPVYVVMRTLGLDRVAINRIFQLAQRSRHVRRVGATQAIPNWMKKLIRKTGVSHETLDITLSTVGQRLVAEGVALSNIQNVGTYCVTQAVGFASSHLTDDLSRVAGAVGRGGQQAAHIGKDALGRLREVAAREIGVLRSLATEHGSQHIAESISQTSNIFITTEDIVADVENTLKATTKTTTGVTIDDIEEGEEGEEEDRLVSALNDLSFQTETKEHEIPTPEEVTASELPPVLAALQANNLPITTKVGITVRQRDEEVRTGAADRGLGSRLLAATNLSSTVGVIGTSLILGALTGGTAGGLQSAYIRNTLFDVMLTKTGFSSFVGKFSGKLAQSTIGKMLDLEKPLFNKNLSDRKRSQYVNQFFALLIGEQLYSEEQVDAMSTVEDFRNALVAQGVDPSRFPQSSRASIEQWRQLLRQHQAGIMDITSSQLVASLGQHLGRSGLVAGVSSAYQNYGQTIMEAANSGTLSRLAGLNGDLINALNVAATDPGFAAAYLSGSILGVASTASNTVINVSQDVQASALQAVELINNLFAARPDIVQELIQPASVVEDTNTVEEPAGPEPIFLVSESSTTHHPQDAQRREELKAIRSERRARAELLTEESLQQTQIHREERLRQFATKYGLTEGQIAGVTNMGDLQKLLQGDTLRKTHRPLTTTTIDRAVEYGTLADDQLLDPKLMDELKKIEFTPLYETVRNAAVEGAAHWIPGYGWINIANRVIDAANIGKNTYNIGVALNKVFAVNEKLKDAPYAPLEDVPHIPSINEILEDNFVHDKINLLTIVLQGLKDQVVNQWTTGELLTEIASQAAGSAAFEKDFGWLSDENLGWE